MSEKLCVFCKHFDFDEGIDCDTCGYDAHYKCNQGNHYLSLGDGVDDFRKEILKAMQCPDYENYLGRKE